MSLADRTIGLVPAAGRATRLGALPVSKELLPLGMETDADGASRVRPVCSVLLGSFRASGIRRAYVVIREGKWDIPSFLGSGQDVGVSLAYAMMTHPYGAPFTLDAAYPFVRDSPVALGFPDTLFGPPESYMRLLETLESSACDVVLGLFPTDRPESTDMVECDAGGRALRLLVKQPASGLSLAWCIAVWQPAFSEYLHDYVQRLLSEAESSPERRHVLERGEHYVGQVISDALKDGLDVRGVQVSEEPFLDIGTPETLSKALRSMRF